MIQRWEGVPRRLARTLLDAGWDDQVLGALVTCRDDGRQILDQLMPELRGDGYERSLDEIWALAEEMNKKRKSVVRAMAQAAKQPRLEAPVELSTSEAYTSLVAGNIELAQKVFKSRRARMLQFEGAVPENIEAEETKRWAAEVARYISLAGLPAKAVAEGTADPMATWLRLCGSRRPRTLRQTARSWSKFHSWLQLAHGADWPRDEAMVIDYLEELAQGGCQPSQPSSLLSSIQVLEAIGGIPRDVRLGLSPMLMNVVRNMGNRKVKELPIFVSRMVSLTGKDWLRVGVELYEEEAQQFPGILFLCKPRRDGTGFTRNYMDSALLASWMKWTIGQLAAPRRAVGLRLWLEDRVDLLAPDEWRSRWSGHSARHCLPSWSAALGVPAEQRSFVGRWKAGIETDANSYVLTSRQIVHGVQELVAKAFSVGDPKSFIETEVLEDLKTFAEERNLEWRQVLRSHQIWRRRGDAVALGQKFPMLETNIWQDGMLAAEDDLALLDTEVGDQRVAPYWVSISRKTGFRRLHRWDGCGVKPANVHSSEEVWEVKPGIADKKCLVCFRDGKDIVREDEADSTSGSSSSSSSESEHQMDD